MHVDGPQRQALVTVSSRTVCVWSGLCLERGGEEDREFVLEEDREFVLECAYVQERTSTRARENELDERECESERERAGERGRESARGEGGERKRAHTREQL